MTPPRCGCVAPWGFRTSSRTTQTAQAPGGLHVGIADVRDAFHHLRMAARMRPYFCLAPVLAKKVGISGKVLDGVTLAADDEVWPCARSLPMGFSWSLCFCQEIGVQRPLADGRGPTEGRPLHVPLRLRRQSRRGGQGAVSGRGDHEADDGGLRVAGLVDL